jgi:hypothetical protein
MTDTARCSRWHCGERLTERHDHTIGRIAFVCLACARNAQGICRDCPAPLPSSRRMRCEGCAAAHTRHRDKIACRVKRADDATRKKLNGQKRRRYHTDPRVRAASLAGNKEYRAAHPERFASDDFNRTYRREWMRNRRKDRSWALAINTRRREVEELKRRGLWPAVKHLPLAEVPLPRRKFEQLAVLAQRTNATRTARRNRARSAA